MKNKKGLRVALCLVAVVALTVVMCVPALAAEPLSIKETMTTSFQTVVTDIMDVFTGILPIAMTILGLTATVGFGIKWFKKLAGIQGS